VLGVDLLELRLQHRIPLSPRRWRPGGGTRDMGLKALAGEGNSG